jgi:hypothetical protein
MIITGLSQHEDLKSIHTIIRSKHSEQPDFVTMQYIEEQVTSVLNDVKSDISPAVNKNEDVVASIASFLLRRRTDR